jgi:hypothetical protein
MYFGTSQLIPLEMPQERETHPSSNDDFLCRVQKIFDQFDFVNYFGAAQNSKNLLIFVMEDGSKMVDLLFH